MCVCCVLVLINMIEFFVIVLLQATPICWLQDNIVWLQGKELDIAEGNGKYL